MWDTTNENGDALFLEYYPLDVRLTATIVDYCEKVVALAGTKHFIIDREVNSQAVASEFEARGWGLLCMLDKNQYKNLSDWDVKFIGKLEDGSKVYSGLRENPGEDSRIFVIVEKDSKLLPYWGTTYMEKIAKPIDWPKIYSRRTEVTEQNRRGLLQNESDTKGKACPNENPAFIPIIARMQRRCPFF